MIFLCKISQDMVEGYNVSRARECSLGIKGTRILTFSLPDSVTLTPTKSAFDTFLEKVADQPTVGGLQRAAESSLLDILINRNKK